MTSATSTANEAAYMTDEQAEMIFNDSVNAALAQGREYKTACGLVYVLELGAMVVEYFGAADRVQITGPDCVLFVGVGTLDGLGHYRWRQGGFAWRDLLWASYEAL